MKNSGLVKMRVYEMKTYVKVALGVVLFIALVGILVGVHLFGLKHKDLSKTRPDFTINATVLQKAFEDDETAASKLYINKILEVTGKIASVKPLAENKFISISLVTGSDLSSVICTFPAISDPSKLSVGEEITLRGECSGFLMDVLLNNCALIQNKK